MLVIKTLHETLLLFSTTKEQLEDISQYTQYNKNPLLHSPVVYLWRKDQVESIFSRTLWRTVHFLYSLFLMFLTFIPQHLSVLFISPSLLLQDCVKAEELERLREEQLKDKVSQQSSAD